MDREQGRRMSDLVDNLRKHATLMRGRKSRQASRAS
jgi:hypothetical protein